MKTAKFQLRGNNTLRAGAFELLRGHVSVQLRGNSAEKYNVMVNSEELIGTTISDALDEVPCKPMSV
jgi:hypothetical protein